MAALPADLPLQGDEQLLVRAGELVERGWCRNGLAQDRFGRQVEPWSHAASAWSPLGALLRAWCECGWNRIDAFGSAYLALSLATGGRVTEWNAAPWRTKWHVISAFGRARENLSDARKQSPPPIDRRCPPIESEDRPADRPTGGCRAAARTANLTREGHSDRR
jgi:hypothetical protein